MNKQTKWEAIFQQASEEVQQWRRKNKKATLTEIENTVDDGLAKIRAQMIEDLAMASEAANLNDLTSAERPTCPQCGQPLSGNGKQKRQLVTEHEQVITLTRSKGVCPRCGGSFFPSG